MYSKVWLYLVIGAHTLATFYFWVMGSGPLFAQGGNGLMLSLGRLCGLILVSFAMLQLLIMSRAPWAEQAFGLDKLARAHHKVGRYFVIFLIAHPLLIVVSYSKFLEIGYIAQYLQLLKSDDIVLASLAFLLFFGIIIYSLLRVWKNWNFERWYYVHLAMYAAIALAFFHQIELGGDFGTSSLFAYYWYLMYAFVGINLLYFRFLTPYLLFRKHHFTVLEIKPETVDVNSVYITGDRMNDFKFSGGQFMIVRFLARPFFREAHPFSISKNYDGLTLRQSIKGSGDFTKKIPQIKPGTKVLIEGPYGIFTAQRSWINKVLLIAGGIGITPYIAILEDLGKSGKDIVLIYGNKTETDIALRSELEAMSEKYNIRVHHVLSSRNTVVSGQLGNSSSTKQTTDNRPLTTFSSGFVNNDLIKQLVPDAADREVFLCGPPPMMNALIKSLPAIGVNKRKIYFEKFSL